MMSEIGIFRQTAKDYERSTSTDIDIAMIGSLLLPDEKARQGLA
jgi:hypothetical protein